MNYPIPSHHEWDIVDSSKITEEFLKCKRKYFYRNILGWTSDAPNNHLHFGTCWHLAMEHLLLNDYSNESIEHAFFEIFEPAYRAVFPETTDIIFHPKTTSFPHEPTSISCIVFDLTTLHLDSFLFVKIPLTCCR